MSQLLTFKILNTDYLLQNNTQLLQCSLCRKKFFIYWVCKCTYVGEVISTLQNYINFKKTSSSLPAANRSKGFSEIRGKKRELSFHLHFSYDGFKSHAGQLSIATSHNPSVMNTICISSSRCKYVITCARLRLKQMWQLTKAMAEMKREH